MLNSKSLGIIKRSSISQPSAQTSSISNALDDDISQVVFTRGEEDALYFEANQLHQNNREESIESYAQCSSSISKERTRTAKIRFKLPDERNRNDAKVNMRKPIHRIPVTTDEVKGTRLDALKRITKSAPSRVEVNPGEVHQGEVTPKSEVYTQTPQNTNAKTPMPPTDLILSKLILGIMGELIAEKAEDNHPVIALPIAKSSNESNAQVQQHLRSSSRSLISNQDYTGHTCHVKSHANAVNKYPKYNVLKKVYTPVVDVNNQYDYLTQCRENKLNSMTWIHRMVLSDFDDYIEKPLHYEESCYFVKKKMGTHRPKAQSSKVPLSLGNAVIYPTLNLLNTFEQELADNHITSTRIEKTNHSVTSQKASFWEFKDNLITPKGFTKSIKVETSRKVKVDQLITTQNIKCEINQYQTKESVYIFD